jgi:DNA-directed RNA polymerase subunit RPC12/RpoP
MPFVMRNESFRCVHCGLEVPPHPTGSARNHCPSCLYSLHVDAEFPGDRAADCGSPMRPVDLEVRKNRGTVLVHECVKCGKRIVNKVAPDDDVLAFSAARAERLAKEMNFGFREDSSFRRIS